LKCPETFYLEQQSFMLHIILIVRAPVQDSFQSTYSFVQHVPAMSAAVLNSGYTISSGAGGPNTKRSLCL
jgi:hypothetical protein